MQTYTKPALSFEQQIELLKNRGLNISDEERAKRHLSNVSYYRLSAYMLPYKIMQANGVVTDDFINGTIWDDIWNLYKFDRKLRLLVFDAIERIEIALRTQIIYQLSHKYGPHWQNNNNLFKTTLNSKTGKIYSVYNDIHGYTQSIMYEIYVLIILVSGIIFLPFNLQNIKILKAEKYGFQKRKLKLSKVLDYITFYV